MTVTQKFKLYTIKPSTITKDVPPFDASTAEMIYDFSEFNTRRACGRAEGKIAKYSHRYGVGQTFYLREVKESGEEQPVMTWRVEADSEDGGMLYLFRKDLTT